MKFVIKLFLIGIVAFFMLQLLNWWIIVIIPFIVNLFIKTKGAGAFFSSFLGVGFSWFIASYNLYSNGASAFTSKMAMLFALPANGVLFLIITSALIGLMAALSGYSANALRNIFVNPNSKKKSKYGRPDYSKFSR